HPHPGPSCRIGVDPFWPSRQAAARHKAKLTQIRRPALLLHRRGTRSPRSRAPARTAPEHPPGRRAPRNGAATSRGGHGTVKIRRSWHASWPSARHCPYCGTMARTTPAPASGRSLPVALMQTIYLLLGLLAVSALAGVLMAAFFLPMVSAGSAVAKDGVALFDPHTSEREVEPLNEASRIEAADGSLLATFYTENRIMVPLEDISPHIQHAVIAVEDRRFYEHGGIDPKGMVRAFASNAAGGATQGGSTLTQQYVKNALLMDAVQRGDQEDQLEATEQSYGRKLREAKLALSLEKKWTKAEILNAYLNVAQFGPSQYGVETGARHYFSKSAADLNPGEAALLAGVTNGPNQYDPVSHPEAGQKRRNEVL